MSDDQAAKRTSGRVSAFAIPIICYTLTAILYFGRDTDWTKSYFGQGPDPLTVTWFIAWWPFAIAHGLNPFISHYVWFPDGFNLTWATSVPAAALFGFPVTALAGPLATFNLLSLCAPVLSAWTAFLLCKRLSGDFVAALVGGYLFGFSSYECGQLLGHLNLDLTFLIPIAVLLGIERAAGDLSRREFICRFAAVLVLQLALSTEVLATLCVFGALTWVIFLTAALPEDRSMYWRLAHEAACALMIVLPIASPFLFFMVKGLPEVPHVINSPRAYSADLLNYIVPTQVTYFGRSLAPLAHRLAGGNASEQGAYLGLPLILMIAAYFRSNIHQPYIRPLCFTLLAIIVASLGPTLQVLGTQTYVPLPWLVLSKVPLLRSALPGRFTMYVSLVAGVVAARYLSGEATMPSRWRRLAWAAVACAALVPNRSLFAWTPLPSQSFFSPDNIRHALGARRNVLILPFGGTGGGMAWQLASNMAFTQSGGYAGFTPASETLSAAIRQFATGRADPTFNNDISAFCGLHSVDYILVAPNAPTSLKMALAALAWPHHLDHGMDIVAVPPLDKLSFYAITGDFWPSAEHQNWMGHAVAITMHRRAAWITLDGKWRPSTVLKMTLATGDGSIVYSIRPEMVQKIYVRANTTLNLSADSTFVPNRLASNGDFRSLSVLISVDALP